MCGFLYARLHKNNDPVFGQIFHEALQLMQYRGPDAFDVHHHDHHYFGHVRLSILDLSHHSNQPLLFSNGILLFTGEIYNYQQLVNDAKSDTLALAHMLSQGIDISQKLNGMYAILFYNLITKTTTILRDFYGEKIVYYYHDQHVFIASSTIKSIRYILRSFYQKDLIINKLALYEYLLCGFVREPHTIYEDIKVLAPGHQLIFSSNELVINNNHLSLLTNATLTPREYIDLALSTYDVRPSLLLSSGVDSTYLLSLIQGRKVDFNLMTYKAPQKIHDESAIATDHVKKICGSEVRSFNILENHDSIDELFDQYHKLLEQPSSDGINLFNILSMFRQIDIKAKLIFLGVGGDELYGGYQSFRNYKKFYLLRSLPMIQYAVKKYQRFNYLSDQNTTPELYYFLYRSCPFFIRFLPGDIQLKLFNQFHQEMKKYQSQTNIRSRIKRCETFDYMRNQLLRDVDNTSLYCGFEARNPLLSTMGYLLPADFKTSMKLHLKRKHDLSFTRKKGFTFSPLNRNFSEILIKKIIALHLTYPIFSPSILDELILACRTNFNLLSKVYNLLAWLNTNQADIGEDACLLFG